MFTHRNINVNMVKLDQYYTIGECQFFIFMELKPLFNYFVITKTLNLSNEKWILAYLG